MVIELEGIEPQLDRLADDWTQGVDHGGAWPVKIVAAKYRTVEAAWKVVDTALDLAGGYGIFAASGIERLFRDARLEPDPPRPTPLSTHEIVGKLTPRGRSRRAAALGLRAAGGRDRPIEQDTVITARSGAPQDDAG